MLFTSKESVDESIIRLLSKGKTTPMELFEVIEKEGKNVTIQAMYKALRSLIKGAVVVKSGQVISLNLEWLEKLTNAFHSQTSLPVLADGESASYKYNSLSNLDAYWKHLMKAFDQQKGKYPVYLFSPYHIWYHLSDRTESETQYFNDFQNKRHHGFFVIGNDSPTDKTFKQKFQSDHLQIDAWHESPLKDNDYLTIIDDYIIHTILDNKITEEIRNFYLSNDHSDETRDKLSKTLALSSKSKIKIERNNKKAKLLRKKLSKNFFIPKELKSKYNLF